MKYIIDITDNGQFVFDDTQEGSAIANCESLIELQDLNTLRHYFASKSLKDTEKVIYSNFKGCYIPIVQLNELCYPNKKTYLEVYGNGDFPYKLINYNYAANLSMKFFNDLKNTYLKTETINTKHTLSNYLPYTFGIEFETSSGYVPEEDCFYYGLIPLRDGSISGVEYSTVVLEGNSGLDLLNQQMDVLNKYTLFNKECALHIHFGGFPLDTEKILRLNNIFSNLCDTAYFYEILPSATFNTASYKKNKKDYCKKNNPFITFDDLFMYFTGQHYMGSLKQPHPNDIDRCAKWNVKSRYMGLNLVNMCCYNDPKTVEFRFLRPTRNVHIIIFWIYILNAIMQYAEMTDKPDVVNLDYVLKTIYPKPIFDSLIRALDDLSSIRTNQFKNGDVCNNMYQLEDTFKLNNNLI